MKLTIIKVRKVLLTIDDGYSSFTKTLGQFLKRKKFHLFCLLALESRKKGYMSWEQIREIDKYEFTEMEIIVIHTNI